MSNSSAPSNWRRCAEWMSASSFLKKPTIRWSSIPRWSYLEALQKAGIKVFRYTKGFMHHKVVLVDDEYCTVGTANFDNRSFRLNFEITMAFADRDFTRQVAAMLENDLSHARLVRPGELQEHGFLFRFAVRAARLTAPVQ